MPRIGADYLTSLPVIASSAPPTGPRTVVCFGLPRGGTSMVAGAVLGLGVPMGEGLANNIEDPAFNIVAHGGTLQDFADDARETIRARNAAFDVWGWKCPFAVRYLPQILDELRAPRLVYVYRDPVPVALRARELGEDALDYVTKRLKAQARHTQLISEMGVPCLLVSYALATTYPEVFLEELAAFLGLDLPAHKDEVTAFLAPGTYKDPAPLIARLKVPGGSSG